MGGSVAIIMRSSSGEVFKFDAHTRHYEFIQTNPKFLSGDDSFIQDYMEVMEIESNSSLAPDCYGITVFDFQTKKIFDIQGYINLTEICYNEQKYGTGLSRNVFNTLSHRVLGFHDYKPIDVTSYNFNTDHNNWLILNLSPWEYIKLDEDRKSYRKLRKELGKLGFIFTVDEETRWKEWIKEMDF